MEDQDATIAWDKGMQRNFVFFAWLICLWLILTFCSCRIIRAFLIEEQKIVVRALKAQQRKWTPVHVHLIADFTWNMWSVRMRCLVAMVTRSPSTYTRMGQSERMEADYLKRVVGACLAEGLAEVSTMRPSDPIEYLALWILKHKQNLKQAV